MGMFEKNDKKVATNTEVEAKEPMQEEVKKDVAPQAARVNEEVAIISPSTKIDGNITTSGNLMMSGTVLGNVSCESVIVDCKTTNSNIKAAKNVIIKEGTTVEGDVHCQNITVNGTVKGNIVASGSVFLKKTASVAGNITAASFGMECGAKLTGQVNCK